MLTAVEWIWQRFGVVAGYPYVELSAFEKRFEVGRQ
jgi:hypothetical protein